MIIEWYFGQNIGVVLSFQAHYESTNGCLFVFKVVNNFTVGGVVKIVVSMRNDFMNDKIWCKWSQDSCPHKTKYFAYLGENFV